MVRIFLGTSVQTEILIYTHSSDITLFLSFLIYLTYAFV